VSSRLLQYRLGKGHVALRFVFHVTQGCLDGMLPLVGVGLGAGPQFGWLGLGAASGRAAGTGSPGPSASV
jgi:hypothetical protein